MANLRLWWLWSYLSPSNLNHWISHRK